MGLCVKSVIAVHGRVQAGRERFARVLRWEEVDVRGEERRKAMIQFTVYGTPQPQGSTRAFIPKGWQRPIITTANKKNKPWRQEVSGAAVVAMEGQQILDRKCAVGVTVDFYFTRPKSVHDSAKTTKPDIDKLVRSVLDGMTGIVFTDDSQVVRIMASKQFGAPERAVIQAGRILFATIVG